MAEERHDLMDSLDVDSPELMPYIPYLLKDLWELGSIPGYTIDLVERHIPTRDLKNVIDLGCGKGAVLIRMAEALGTGGIGIDLIPEFIAEARERAEEADCGDKVQFETGDIKDVVALEEPYDLVIYGHDSDIFGDVRESLAALKKVTAPNGWIILETVYLAPEGNEQLDPPNEAEFKLQLQQSGMEVIESILWEADLIKTSNARNTRAISRRVEDLVAAYPEKQELFAAYLAEQMEECKELEEDLVCVTVLLQNQPEVVELTEESGLSTEEE